MSDKPGHRRFAVTLAPSVAERVLRAARQDHRCASFEIAHLVELGLREREAGRGPPDRGEEAGVRRFTIALKTIVAEKLLRAADEDHRKISPEIAHLVELGLQARDARRASGPQKFRTVGEFLPQEAAGEEPSYGARCDAYLEQLMAEEARPRAAQ
jgi:hypothetical protein